MQKITIAIDGFSSTGKSTVAKQLASHLGYIYVDSGAMYRAVTLYAMQNKFIDESHFDVEGLKSHLHQINIHFEINNVTGNADVYLNNINVEYLIRSIEVSNFVSQIATVPEVRSQLVIQQQKMGEAKGVVMDGRDIGTVVFPKAELKLFMTASVETRAQRRYNELKWRGDDVTFEEVLHNIQERDYIDSHREDSPLRKADDAIEIDNSSMTLDEQFHKILKIVNDTFKSLK